jgi:hypothetical protein
MTTAPKPTRRRGADPRLVRYAWIAARLEGISVKEGFEAWSEKHFGRRLTKRDIERHVNPIRVPPHIGRSRKEEVPPAPSPTPALQDWVRVDERRLQLLSVLFELPNRSSAPRPGLFEALEDLSGLRHVIELREDGDILALGVVRSMEEAETLQEEVSTQAAGQPLRMRVIERESQNGAARTWFDVALRQAK